MFVSCEHEYHGQPGSIWQTVCALLQSCSGEGIVVTADKQGYQQSYDAALVGADRSKDLVVLRVLNLQVCDSQ